MGLWETVWGKMTVMTVGSFHDFTQIMALTFVLHVKVMILMKSWSYPTIITVILPQAVSHKPIIKVQCLTKVLVFSFSKVWAYNKYASRCRFSEAHMGCTLFWNCPLSSFCSMAVVVWGSCSRRFSRGGHSVIVRFALSSPLYSWTQIPVVTGVMTLGPRLQATRA